MPVQLGVNGFGRIGRLVCRAAIKNPEVKVVLINDPFMDTEYMAYLFKYDSVHGVWKGTVEHTADSIIVDGVKIAVSAEKDPASIPWGKNGADYVCESTGVFTTSEKCQGHLKGGAKKSDHLCSSQG